MDDLIAWVQVAWFWFYDGIGGWAGLLAYAWLCAMTTMGFAALFKLIDRVRQQRREKRARKAQQRIIAQAQAVATAEDERLALEYNVDAAIATVERLLRTRRGDDGQEANL